MHQKDWNVLNKSLLVEGFQKEWAALPMFVSCKEINRDRAAMDRDIRAKHLMDMLKNVKIYR